ncbi:MAG: permease [Alphaproteobacteria bacterium]|nr:permease [Alphaproteobacteria bacterium]
MTAAVGALVQNARKIDPVYLAALALLIAIGVISLPQLIDSVEFLLMALLSISPFLLLSMAAAGGAQATGLDQRISHLVQGRTSAMILGAAFFGSLAPLCSCGVIPLIAALLAAGVPLGPVMAFWISSPLMSIEKYILASAVFDVGFATAYLATAIVMGAVAGFVTQALVKRGGFSNTLKAGVVGCCASNALKEDRPLLWKFWQESDRVALFRDTSTASGLFLLKWLSLAFIIESLMVAYLPPEYVGQVLGSGDWWTVPASTIVGIPAYLNGFAAIPMVSRLVEMGAAPGAALAFLTAGAVTSIPAAMGVFALVRKSVFIAYILFGVTGSLIAGYAYQALA